MSDKQAASTKGWFRNGKRKVIVLVTGNHCLNGPEANHALTFKLDHSSGADQV